MDGLSTNTTLLGALVVGVYAAIGKFIWETVKRVWQTKRNGSPPPVAGTDPVVASDVSEMKGTVNKIKSDTSALKERDSERAGALKGIGESNVRQETMMESQNDHLKTLVGLSQEQLAETKRQNGGG